MSKRWFWVLAALCALALALALLWMLAPRSVEPAPRQPLYILRDVNGRVARASYDVKVGDRISLRFGQRTLTVEVLSVQDNVGKDAAALLYREVQA